MFKRLVVFILAALIAGSVFAQERGEEAPQKAQNRISISLGYFEMAYEKMMSPEFSTLFSVSYNTWFLADTLSIAGKARWYPGGGTFFLDLGLGYSYGYDMTQEFGDAIADVFLIMMTGGLILLNPEFEYENKNYNSKDFYRHGLLISPGFGFNIDVGKPDNFYMPIAFGADIRITKYITTLVYFRIGFAYAF